MILQEEAVLSLRLMQPLYHARRYNVMSKLTWKDYAILMLASRYNAVPEVATPKLTWGYTAVIK